MTLRLAYSPCPNDTFIFYAMMHGKVDTEGLQFEVVLKDVEELNQAARIGTYEITKLSFHALSHLQDRYSLLDAGAALGNQCGPLLIGKRTLAREELSQASIAVPGAWTTANFLLDYAFGKGLKKEILLFSEIEQAVLDDRVDLGVIIHENRFTYTDKGLKKIIDLGDHWEKETGLPIPLGGIAILGTLGTELKQKVERVIRNSLEYAWAHPEETLPYLREHAQEMSELVMMQHVDLYVNGYSRSLGERGARAVAELYQAVDHLARK